MKSAYHTAGILALMFDEFKQPRMRISRRTLKKIGSRKRLKDAFAYEVGDWLSDIGVEFIEIERGFCLIKATTLNGAKPFTFSKFRKGSNVNVKSQDDVWALVDEVYEREEDEDEDED